MSCAGGKWLSMNQLTGSLLEASFQIRGKRFRRESSNNRLCSNDSMHGCIIPGKRKCSGKKSNVIIKKFQDQERLSLAV